ncbi:pirin family protein [Shewanella sp. D64]|uniref:pirin family protein n=1 Tax=unclassified Shewanella TaxID=196818 RepID=UPI0022BA52B6|nr:MULTISPECIES: pirin family protein [unclassified Shewanella]MEC4726275.1 pirin family protein [Shewanella sp. D64]MEC4738287.1 pirin family protein [Shewanella sp. E94]WBJ95424.1 pirin family protein [Shewanella sp. MTB7]
MKKLSSFDLREGGFAGLKEHRFVMDSRVFGRGKELNTWDGVGHFVYLADARFMPKGETMMHGHKEVDVISVMVKGRINHEGSLEHGQSISAKQVQVQRAGGEGFSHNEINPDSVENQMIQLWVMPERLGEPAAYQLYSPINGELTPVYGGAGQTFDSRTQISVANLNPGDEITLPTPALVYVSNGSVILANEVIAAGTLVRTDESELEAQLIAEQTSQVIVISLLDS